MEFFPKLFISLFYWSISLIIFVFWFYSASGAGTDVKHPPFFRNHKILSFISVLIFVYLTAIYDGFRDLSAILATGGLFWIAYAFTEYKEIVHRITAAILYTMFVVYSLAYIVGYVFSFFRRYI